MLMELVQKCEPSAAMEPDGDYSEEFHDVNAIIMDLCIALGDTRAFEFRVSGFGEERWPVDVTTDLATVIEQLPECLAACRMGAPFELDMFEQGIERTLEFVPQGCSYAVSCRSGTDWEPEPHTATMEAEAVLAMLSRLKWTFCETCERLFPKTCAHPWFQRYAHGGVA